MVGLKIPDEQQQLLDPPVPRLYVMVAHALPDPFALADGYAAPLEVVDEQGATSHVVIPHLGPVDLSVVTVNEVSAYETGAWRFPSVPVWIREPARDQGFSRPQAVRVWNLWPLDGEPLDRYAVESSAEAVVRASKYDHLVSWASYYQNTSVDPCSFVRFPDEYHGHYLGEHGEVRCPAGDQWFLEHSEVLFHEVDSIGSPGRRRAFHVPQRLPHHLQPLWAQLEAYSRVNSQRSLLSVPPWDRDELRIMERYYIPWFLS